MHFLLFKASIWKSARSLSPSQLLGSAELCRVIQLIQPLPMSLSFVESLWFIGIRMVPRAVKKKGDQQIQQCHLSLGVPRFAQIF